MRNFEFITDISREDFDGFAADNAGRVKTHFLGSYEWGDVARLRGWHPVYAGVKEDGVLAATALVLKKPLVAGYSYFYIPRGFTMDHSDRELLRFMTDSLKALGKKHRALFFKIDPDIRLRKVDVDGHEIRGLKAADDPSAGLFKGAGYYDADGLATNYDLVCFLESLGYRRKPLNYAFENEQPRFTFRTDISVPLDEIRSRYSKTTLHEIRKSSESSVQVYKGTAADIPEFVRLTKMTEERQNYISHEHSFYAKFYDIMHDAGMADIWLGKVDITALTERARSELAENRALLAKYENASSRKAKGMVKEIGNRITALEKKLADLEDRPQGEVIVSAYLTVTYLDKIWTLYGANDMDYSKFFANYAVYEKMIEDANAGGIKVFDGFGTVGGSEAAEAEGAGGLYEFKKKWGGELTEFIGEFDYILNRPVYLAYRKLIPVYHEIRNRRAIGGYSHGRNKKK